MRNPAFRDVQEPALSSAPGGGLLSDVWNDCCDFCIKVDDTKLEVEPCNKMTARCQGDTCSTCKACKDFVPGLGFTSALVLAKRRTSQRMRLIQRVID